MDSIFDFYGTYKTYERNGVKVHTIEEAEDEFMKGASYNWVEVEEHGENYKVLTHHTAPHLWGFGGQIVEETKKANLSLAVNRAFRRVRWAFPTRPNNIQAWSDIE